MSETTLAKHEKNVFELLQSNIFLDRLMHSIPNSLDPKRAVQLAITLIKSSKALRECTPISLMACVVSSAQLGLDLDKLLGHCYMVPFKGEATLIVGYRGFTHLMYQSGIVKAISAEVVRPGDKFRITLGSDRKLIHEPKLTTGEGHSNYENWLGSYAVAHFLIGGSEFEYMTSEQIEAVRARSQSWRAWKREQKETPWVTDAEEMWRKTPIRRLAKRMPVSTTDKREILLRAVMLDEYGERKGLLLPTESGFTVNADYQPEANGSEEPLAATQAVAANATTELLEKSIAQVAQAATPKQPMATKAVAANATAPTTKPGPKAVPKTAKTVQSQPSGPPKAAIPPANDPPLTTPQQTVIYHAAAQAGWKVPEEVIQFIKKRFHVESIRNVRNSQFAELLEKVKSGT